eukprot:TRINITY_DN12786_c0_g1_i2.p1 TRINITY_DN12786_c0_g1~~TRINITY_DN12786_c0_g1_i2.p1  ORF type:complete len:261 (+),score=60.53 TRINITY_DN12786_c0_g1_i2:42-824(+)
MPSIMRRAVTQINRSLQPHGVSTSQHRCVCSLGKRNLAQRHLQSGKVHLKTVGMGGCHSFSSSTRSPREILGVSGFCTEEDVKAAFRREAKRLHPDLRSRSSGESAAEEEAAAEKFRELESAYRRLLREVRGLGPESDSSGFGFEDPTHPDRPKQPGFADPNWQKNFAEAAAQRAKESEARRAASGSGGNLLGVILVLGLTVGTARWYMLRADRRQEKLMEEDYMAKRVRLRQEEAEREQRQLEARLRKQAGRENPTQSS